MPVREYFNGIRNHVQQFPFSAMVEIEEEIRTTSIGYIVIKVTYIDGSELFYREFVSTETTPPARYSYSFHYHKNSSLIFRYDNAPHFKDIFTFPHHKHLPDGTVVPSTAPTIETILAEISSILLSQNI